MSKSLYTVILIHPNAIPPAVQLARKRGEALAAEWSKLVEPPNHGSGPDYLIVRTDLLPTLQPVTANSVLAAQIRLLRFACNDRNWQDATDVLDRLITALGITHEAKKALDAEEAS